jgi:hypothetical protein
MLKNDRLPKRYDTSYTYNECNYISTTKYVTVEEKTKLPGLCKAVKMEAMVVASDNGDPSLEETHLPVLTLVLLAAVVCQSYRQSNYVGAVPGD